MRSRSVYEVVRRPFVAAAGQTTLEAERGSLWAAAVLKTFLDLMR